MAKQQATKKAEATPQPKATVEKQAPVQTKQVEPKKPTWEIKDRLYTLKGTKKPLVFTIPSKHSARKPLLWFDEEKGYQREIKYATNQPSVFVDEQQGIATLGRIVVRDGALRVPKEQQVLQKLLSLYHPMKDIAYEEYNPVQEATDEVSWIEAELEAMNAAKAMSLEEAEAVLRVEYGSEVSNSTSSELKRQPLLFLELAGDDNVMLRNFGIKAAEAGIVKLSSDQRTFFYGDGNRKLMTVPFDEHPYSALASFFKTDEGMEVYKAIEKRLN
jgi:hypothetical protein